MNTYQKPVLLGDDYCLEEATHFLRELSKDLDDRPPSVQGRLSGSISNGSLNGGGSFTSSGRYSKIPVLRECDIDDDDDDYDWYPWYHYRRWGKTGRKMIRSFDPTKNRHLLLAICTTSILWFAMGALYIQSYDKRNRQSGVAMCFDTVMGYPRFGTVTESVFVPSSSSSSSSSLRETLNCDMMLQGVFAQDCLITSSGNATAGYFASVKGSDGNVVGLALSQGTLSLYNFGDLPDAADNQQQPLLQLPPNGCLRPTTYRSSLQWTSKLQGMAQYNAPPSQINRVLWSLDGSTFCTMRKLGGSECDESLRQLVNTYQHLADDDHVYLDLYTNSDLC